MPNEPFRMSFFSNVTDPGRGAMFPQISQFSQLASVVLGAPSGHFPSSSPPLFYQHNFSTRPAANDLKNRVKNDVRRIFLPSDQSHSDFEYQSYCMNSQVSPETQNVDRQNPRRGSGRQNCGGETDCKRGNCNPDRVEAIGMERYVGNRVHFGIQRDQSPAIRDP